MKKLLSSLILPTVITAFLLILLSTSFVADEILTKSRNEFLSVMNQNFYKPLNTLIIDPGHGGEDGGAISVTDGKESELNLLIGKKAELIASFFGINTKMTRESETLEYGNGAASIHDKKVYDTKQRVELINNSKNAVLISIHQNKFSDSTVKGAQIFYRTEEDSLNLAESVNAEVREICKNVRLPSKISDKIYIFKYINCPAVMVECGFISNSEENALLVTNEYQNKLALAMISGYLNYEDQLYKDTVGGTYESKNNILLY